jgi:hypothetical protein
MGDPEPAAIPWHHDQYPQNQIGALATVLWPESRCLLPMSSFCEYADAKLRKTPTWFAIDESRLLVAFAAI